jgi:hypothetical protein
LVLALLLIVTPVSGLAQTRSNTTSLRVLVLDPSGAAISAAEVNVSIGNARPEILKTNQSGEALFNGLKAGQYRVSAGASGFARQQRDAVEVLPGANRLELRLEVALVEEQLTVEQDKREAATDPRGNAFSSVLTAEQIAQLPDDPEEFENAIRQMAGPGAVLRVNGFRGGKLPPKSQIREIRFRMNPYSADNHDAGFVHVDITTKPGIELWNGSFTAAFRDESLNARNPAATYRGPEQTRRFGFELGGPVWKNRTSLFLSADGVNEYDTRTIIAEVPQGRVDGLVIRPNRRLNLAVRAEHALNKTHTMRGEYQRNGTRRDNLGAGDFDLPERAYSSDAVENIARVSDSGVIGKSLVNEFRFQSTWQSNSIDSLSNAPTIIVQNAFTSGGAQIENSRNVNEIELADNLDFSLGRNVMRAGVLFEYQRARSNELRNITGTFTFGSLAQFNAGTPITYSRRIGDPRVDYAQYQTGWYFQDDLRLRKSLSLSLGLRHEFQSIVGSRTNFAPRLGLAWSPFKDGKTTVRAGLGVFYDWFPGEIYEQTLRVDGVKQRDLITQNPGFPIPSSGDDAVSLPPSRIQIDPTLQQPTVYQLSLSAERQLPGNLMFRGGYVFQRGLHLLRGRNVNAPLSDGARPNPSLGNITQIESSANSFTHSLSLNLNWSKPGGYFFGGNYTLAKATSETDSPVSLPVNNRDLRGERGPSLSDARHRFMMFSSFTLWKLVRLGVSYQFNSATPYNITTGFDDNGDTVVNDRPSGVTRNSARGAGRSEVGLRLGYGFGWGKPREASSGGGPQVRVIRGDGGDILGGVGSLGAGGNKRYRMEFYAQAFNVLNHANVTGFSGVMSSPFFGQPISALPGRRMETGIRFNF